MRRRSWLSRSSTRDANQRTCVRRPECRAGVVVGARRQGRGSSELSRTSSTPSRAAHRNRRATPRAAMTVAETLKEAVGLAPAEPKSPSATHPRPIGCMPRPIRRTDCRTRGHPPGDERRPPAAGLPRLVRTPAHPAEPLPLRDLLPAVEVRGMRPEPALPTLVDH